MTVPNSWQSSALLARKAIGKLRRRLVTIPRDPVIRTINGSIRFEHKFLPFLNEDDFRAMLTGSYDLLLCGFMKRHLGAGDIVIDVGANVGFISAVAASCVGTKGEVHGFEPLPECYARLERLRELNPQFRLNFSNIALGERDEVLPIAYNPEGDSRNATLVPGKHSSEVREVPVRRLDEYIADKISQPERVRLIKIDVEGFEFPVLRGLEGFLTSFRPLIVCEVKPWELRNLGFSLNDMDGWMKKFGYRAHLIADENKEIDLVRMTDMDVIVWRSGSPI